MGFLETVSEFWERCEIELLELPERNGGIRKPIANFQKESSNGKL